jgi:hypothetical protein
MSIKEIVRIALLEAQMSKETETFLIKKWEGLSLDTIRKIFDWFELKKNSFNINNPQPEIATFLGYFNGKGNRPLFEPKNLRDIRSYTPQQITFLWNEYKPLEKITVGSTESEKPVDEIFYKTVGKSPNSSTISDYVNGDTRTISEYEQKLMDELFKKSKELWEGQKFLIHNDNGFRVYECPDQITSISFGWYLYYIRYKYKYSGSNWCTTTPSANNYFSGKRTDRSFYFVIDESKFPQTTGFTSSESVPENFYLCALQIMSPNYREYGGSPGSVKYKLSGIHNPGEITYSYEKLLELYPKLKPLLDEGKLQYVPWKTTDQVDSKNIDPISMINEVEGHEYEFAVRPYTEKEEYINRDGVLRRGRSWDYMNKELKKKYIFDRITRQNLFDKVSTSELFKKFGEGDRNTLDRKIRQITDGKDGIGLVIKNIMQNDFYVDEHISLNKDYISVYKNRTTNKYGIYNLNENSWVNHDGITYDDSYSEVSGVRKAYQTVDGKRFVVIAFSKTSEPNESSFYIIVPYPSKYADGYFLSAKKWEELKLKTKDETSPEKTNVEYDPETDGDEIQEIKKGV